MMSVYNAAMTYEMYIFLAVVLWIGELSYTFVFPLVWTEYVGSCINGKDKIYVTLKHTMHALLVLTFHSHRVLFSTWEWAFQELPRVTWVSYMIALMVPLILSYARLLYVEPKGCS